MKLKNKTQNMQLHLGAQTPCTSLLTSHATDRRVMMCTPLFSLAPTEWNYELNFS